MTEMDQETAVIGTIVGALEGLDDEQRGRVIRYVADRFSVTLQGTGLTLGAKSSPTTPIDPRTENAAAFADFASLYDACQPTTDIQRALVAGYWLQVCQEGASFDSQSANRELKHLGRAIGNITAALDALINQKPALVLQLRKSGSAKQARKTFKLTETGVRQIRSMIGASGELNEG